MIHPDLLRAGKYVDGVRIGNGVDLEVVKDHVGDSSQHQGLPIDGRVHVPSVNSGVASDPQHLLEDDFHRLCESDPNSTFIVSSQADTISQAAWGRFDGIIVGGCDDVRLPLRSTDDTRAETCDARGQLLSRPATSKRGNE